MDQLEEARLAWQRAQADLQAALADLEKRVAEIATGDDVTKARAAVRVKQETADYFLQRYITQLGKS